MVFWSKSLLALTLPLDNTPLFTCFLNILSQNVLDLSVNKWNGCTDSWAWSWIKASYFLYPLANNNTADAEKQTGKNVLCCFFLFKYSSQPLLSLRLKCCLTCLECLEWLINISQMTYISQKTGWRLKGKQIWRKKERSASDLYWEQCTLYLANISATRKQLKLMVCNPLGLKEKKSPINLS